MKSVFAALTLTVIAAVPAFAIEPIDGSIMNGNVSKAPVGSSLLNQVEEAGVRYQETYIVTPDHSLKLVTRIRFDHE